MKVYEFQFSRTTPNDQNFRPEFRGETTVQTAMFSSRKILLIKLKKWNRQGWTYFESEENKQHNEQALPIKHTVIDKGLHRNQHRVFSEVDFFSDISFSTH
jgi:hypothetical protein